MRLWGGIHRAQLMCGAAFVSTMLAAPGVALAQSVDFDIPPQSLSAALDTFAAQSRQPILVTPDMTANKTSPGVQGATETRIALAQLLEGTGLTYRVSGKTFLIVRADDPQGGSAAGGGATVEALIVTAQKREEDIQDVPIAISAFSQEDLTRSQVAGGPDLVTQVPNFTFTKTNFSSYSIQIRGIGTQAISATTDPAVAVAFNNTPFIHNRFFEQEFYDLQRVEVLRGPQGTLYGRNATAGVVNIISAKPKFFFEAKASADLSNYSSSRVEAMVNVPLVEDVVALRIAGAWTKRDGYAFNELTGAPIDGRDLWSTRVSLRITPNDRIDANLIWEHFEENDDRLRSGKQLCRKDVVTHVGSAPTTNYTDVRNEGSGNSLVFSGVQGTFSQGCVRYSLYDQGSFQRPNGLMLPYYAPLDAIGLPAALIDPYANVTGCSFFGGCDMDLLQRTLDQPQDLRVIQSTVDPDYRAKNDLGELQISIDLTDTLTLTSETAYAVDQVWSLEDFNRFNTAHGAWAIEQALVDRKILDEDGVFCDPQLGCSDRLVGVDLATSESSQFSQEFRLASNYDGPFNFSLGANFLRADSYDKYYVFFNSISLIAANPIFVDLPDYEAGKTDNIECLQNGYQPGDPNRAYGVQACTYIDPNPIGQLNDKGHNYFLSNNPYKLISYAVFGETYYQIADNLKLTAGLRWTVDKKEAPRIPTWILASQSVGYPIAGVIEQEWREPTGRLTLDWKPDLPFTDETLLYGSFAHGYKAGGANPPGYVREFYADEVTALKDAAESETRPKTFDPEFVNAFELGSKNTMFDGRVTMNLAAFYYDYEGYQVSEIVDRSAFNRNFDAEVWGAEIEADWRPLENLKIGFKGGYEKTRIADGEAAIDLMDRANGGMPDENGISWIVVRPFPTYASSCIVPDYVFVRPDNTIGPGGGVGGGNPGVCEYAYQFGVDPLVGPEDGGINHVYPGYPGFDPSTAPNGGEGITKQLGGNELPNAPHWTATITGDYSLPLTGDWLMTLHTDIHWQSQSWWRVFNDHVYDKLHPYFTMNLAAIFTNEEAGWNVMAYVKNVTDETAITGAFLNSDDTGLTTNVFLTEPRLYGVRVTKAWSGGPLLGTFGSRHDGPYAFTVELGGQATRNDAPNQPILPSYNDAFAAPLDIFDDGQTADLDKGDARSVRLTWRPDKGPWSVHADYRYGSANKKSEPSAQWSTEPVCLFGGFIAFACDSPEVFGGIPALIRMANFSTTNHAEAMVLDGESYQVTDIGVGRDFGLTGSGSSAFGAALRHAKLESATGAHLTGVPDWVAEAGSFESLNGGPVTHTLYNIDVNALREFKGVGPTVSWDAAFTLFALGDGGRLDIDWSANGGVLFGERETAIAGTQLAREYESSTFASVAGSGPPILVDTIPGPDVDIRRSEDVTVPVVDLSLGFSYRVDRFQLSTGYRWERYFDAIDGGFEQSKDEDRTIDGPYLKVSVGFGG